MATVRHKKPENWLAAVADNGNGISEQRELALPEQASEAMLMGLRLDEGIDLSALSARFGMEPDKLCDPGKLAFYIQQGLAWQNGTRIGISGTGMPLLDGLLGELVPAALVNA